MKKILMLTIASVFGVSAYAQINPIGEFVGDYSEGYEGFPNYSNGGFYQSLDIMGGNATISSGNVWQAIYEPGSGAEFGLADKGLATVNSGAKAWGEDYSGVFEIKFVTPMVAFGAYWNYAYYSGATDAVTLAFYDSSNSFIGNTQFTDPQDNKMRWHGWSSNTPFSRIEIRGDYVVMDDTQALVPEPATILAVGAGLALFIRRRKA